MGESRKPVSAEEGGGFVVQGKVSDSHTFEFQLLVKFSKSIFGNDRGCPFFIRSYKDKKKFPLRSYNLPICSNSLSSSSLKYISETRKHPKPNVFKKIKRE